MKKEINIVIVEDDPYARDFISMMLRRDWRTRVVGEFGCNSALTLQHALRSQTNRVDILIVDTEVPEDESWPVKVQQIVRALPNPPILVYTCTSPDPRQLERILSSKGGGYLVKSEIMYGLASALSAAVNGQFVMTPGVLIVSGRLQLPANAQMMDGTMPVVEFTAREKDLTRLGLLFNLSQREIADDLIVSTDFVAEVMGQVYEKLGLKALMSGEETPENVFQDEKLLDRCRQLLSQYQAENAKPGRKISQMSTLAFHLLTMPETTDLD